MQSRTTSIRSTAPSFTHRPLAALCSRLSRLLSIFWITPLELARFPGLVEPRLWPTLEAKDYEPTLARNRLYPAVLLSGRGLGAELDIHRTIGVGVTPCPDCWRSGIAGRSVASSGVLFVVDDDRPEILDHDIRRQVQLVSLCAVDRVPIEPVPPTDIASPGRPSSRPLPASRPWQEVKKAEGGAPGATSNFTRRVNGLFCVSLSDFSTKSVAGSQRFKFRQAFCNEQLRKTGAAMSLLTPKMPRSSRVYEWEVLCRCLLSIIA